jgi:hypothetical protein
MTFKYQKKRLGDFKLFLKIFFILLFFILLIVSAILTSILIFGKSPKSLGEKLVKISFKGPEEIESLSLEEFEIEIVNLEFADLKLAELKLNFPNGFILKEISKPCDEKLLNGCIWHLGKLKRNETYKLSFKGYFYEASFSINDLKSFLGDFDFEFQDFTSHFKKEFKKGIFVKPVLSIDLEAEEKILVGSSTKFKIILKNLSEQFVNDLKIVLGRPNNFIFENFENFKEGIEFFSTDTYLIWKLEELKPLEEKSFYFQGLFKEYLDSPIEFNFKIGLSKEDQFFFQNSVVKRFFLLKPNLRFTFSTTNQKTIFQPGEEIPLYFVYTNTENVVEDLNFEVEILNADLIDWQNSTSKSWQWFSELEIKEGNEWLIKTEKERKIIIWNSSLIPQLKKISTESGEIRFSLNLLADQNLNNREIIFKPRLFGFYSLTNKKIEIEGPSLILKIKL